MVPSYFIEAAKCLGEDGFVAALVVDGMIMVEALLIEDADGYKLCCFFLTLSPGLPISLYTLSSLSYFSTSSVAMLLAASSLLKFTLLIGCMVVDEFYMF